MKKHILCLGDSNTHGFCADPADSADGGPRFNEEERWTCLLQEKLGRDYLIIEEGLNGRTTVFPDPLRENADVLPHVTAILRSHQPLDLLVIMLGTNDTKERFCVNAPCIAGGMERLVRKAMSVDCWGGKTPNILIVAPPPIQEGVYQSASAPTMGRGCVEKSEQLASCYQATAQLLGVHFMNAAGCQFNQIDFMHLTRKGHAQMAEKFAAVIPSLV